MRTLSQELDRAYQLDRRYGLSPYEATEWHGSRMEVRLAKGDVVYASLTEVRHDYLDTTIAYYPTHVRCVLALMKSREGRAALRRGVF